MPKGIRRVRIFSALEVANICGVVNQTAINWIRNGHLKAFTTPGGQYRIYAKDLAAFLEKRGMSASGEVLQIMTENANWNTFLIAAHPSINDNLKAQMAGFLSGYSVIQAFDWFEIGRKITEEKPGFVLLDAELSGVDISKFIQTLKSDPVFGRPYIILLSNSSAHFEVDLRLSNPPDMGKLEEAMKGFQKQADAAITA